MPKQDQVVEEKVLSFKTLTVTNLEQVSKFIVHSLRGYDQMGQDERARLYSLTHSIMIPALQSQWSFGLCQEDKIIGVYLQVDVLDYLNISKLVTRQAMSQIFSIGHFEDYFAKIAPTIKRGDYVVTLFNVVNSHNFNQIRRKQLTLIHQGFYLIKLGGWKNILFVTQNPIPFLKINAQVIMEGQESKIQSRKYLMKMKMNQLNLSVSPFQKIYAKL